MQSKSLVQSEVNPGKWIGFPIADIRKYSLLLEPEGRVLWPLKLSVAGEFEEKRELNQDKKSTMRYKKECSHSYKLLVALIMLRLAEITPRPVVSHLHDGIASDCLLPVANYYT